MNNLLLIFRYFKGLIGIPTSSLWRYTIILLFFQIPASTSAQVKFDFYTSNAGNDNFNGTSNQLPKKTIAGIAPVLQKFSTANGKVKLGLKGGDVFEEGLITSYPIEIGTYENNNNGNEFVILNGTKEFGTGWLKEPGKTSTYHQSIPYNGFMGYGIGAIGQYSYISVFEIDRALEKTAPFTARTVLTFVPDSTAVENTAGSFYTPVTNRNPLPVYIHTSDGNSPNDHKKYRYEVTIRDWAINSTYQPGNRFENLWVRGFGAGNGMLPGGNNSYYNKIVFGPGAGIHHLGVRSGTINHSLFLPGAKNTSQFAVVFYDVEGLGRHCYIKNSIFLDIPMPVYTHTSLGANYGSVEMENVVGFADTLLPGPFMYTSNNDTVILNNIYADGYASGYNYGNARYAAISNSCFRDITFGIAFNDAYNAINSKIENVLIKTKGTAFTSGIIMGGFTTLSLNNSIVHLINSNKSPVNSISGAFVAGSGGNRSKIVAKGNIFICDIDPANFLTAAKTNTDDGIGTSKDSWDNNVYILVKGNAVHWSVSNPSTNGGSYTIRNFEDWKKQSGQDKHSVFFDLRNDPRGLKAIFEDPYNGNYNLANTIEGRVVAGLRAGMTDPLSCFLKRPSYEEAAALIRDNKSFTINKCRNPCIQNRLRENSTFTLDSINKRQVKLKWNFTEQENIAQYVVQKATENLVFTDIRTIPADKDSFYEMIDKVQYGIRYWYRLMAISNSGNKCYSDSRTINFFDTRPFTIYPNPARGKIFISLNGYLGSTSFIVSNSKGEIVLVKEGMSINASASLDLSDKPPGLYWIKVVTSKGISVQNFILY